MRKTFEYTYEACEDLEYLHDDRLDMDKLDKMGAQGWELVAIYNGELIFKREVKENNENRYC